MLIFSWPLGAKQIQKGEDGLRLVEARTVIGREYSNLVRLRTSSSMIFAEFADVGSGCAFLLLLTLSSVGLALILLQVLLKPAKLRSPKPYLLALGLLQAWPVYLWVRFDALEMSRHVLERVWLASLSVAVASLVAYTRWRG